jgi:L-amino acid N-acyltransferase YncA
MRPSDADQVPAIYQAGLDTGQASFETAAPSWDAFDHTKLPLTGTWPPPSADRCSAGSPPAPCHRSRCTAASSSTRSTYMRTHAGRASGPRCSMPSPARLKPPGSWTTLTVIFPENTSLRLHQRAGFRRIGTRQCIGCHHGRWRDVTLLERRSTITGT